MPCRGGKAAALAGAATEAVPEAARALVVRVAARVAVAGAQHWGGKAAGAARAGGAKARRCAPRPRGSWMGLGPEEG